MPALLLLASLGRRDVAAFAAGAVGAWTRLVAPRLGAPVVYGALGEVPGAPGQISIERLRRDYGLPELPPVEALFGLVGNPVTHSLSPRIHNAAYRALGIPALYLPFHADSFGDFWLEVVENGGLEAIGPPIRGLSVTAPYKEAALAVAGAESPLAGLIGAANTLVCNQGVWEAEATDPDGVVLPLRDRGLDIEGMEVAVVGRRRRRALGGGGARPRRRAGDDVQPRRRSAASAPRTVCMLPSVPLADLDPSALRPAGQRHLARPRRGRSAAVRRRAAPPRRGGDRPGLSRRTGRRRSWRRRRGGAVAIDGREVLVDQARGQFRMMTGRELPLDLARRAAGLEELAEVRPMRVSAALPTGVAALLFESARRRREAEERLVGPPRRRGLLPR